MSSDPSEAQPEQGPVADPQHLASETPANPSVDAKPATANSPPASPQPAPPPRRQMMIGSQRDPANPKLAPSKPKPVRAAATTPPLATRKDEGRRTKDETNVQPVRAVEHPVGPDGPAGPSAKPSTSPSAVAASPASAPATVAANVPASPAPEPPPVRATEKVEIPDFGGELDAEIEAALAGMSLDQIVAAQDAAGVADELEEGSRHKALVVKLHGENVFFSLGGRFEGVASLKQFQQPPEPGAMLDVIVNRYSSDDGLYELTIPGASVSVGDWSDVSEGTVVDAHVTGSNTGGLECVVNNIRAFIPVSHIALYRVENLGEFVGQKLQCVVAEANPERRNLVLSRRALLEREREENRQNLLQELQVGQTREGIVRSLRDFGAFVDLGGVDGLIHVSKLSWDHVQHPSEVLQEGQTVKVKVEKIDPATGKIGLSYRDTLADPWSTVEQKYPLGTIVAGKVSRIAKFGAFVKLESGIEGLIHISELAHQRVFAVNNVVSEGQEVEVKVVSVDREAQRIGLSLKATQAAPQPTKKAEPEEPDDAPPRALAVPQRQGPLKGGRDRQSGGENFGLNW